MLEIKTYSPDETFNIGTKLGKLFIEGDLICLEGPLGAGKTHITQGFANGLKIKDHVSSPTFNIIKEYHEGRIPLYHMDLYRLTEPEELIDLGYEEYIYGNGVTVVEWADKAQGMFPEERLIIKLEYGVNITTRVIEFMPLGDRYKQLVDDFVKDINPNASKLED
ncbi:MAG TPA: tRNA (adenosine(37)-N6)-threonylcarbamoyltransferase complex ATPase subunit type 1 TsaE [Thermoanaerobacterales bacterium]|nr:tRNA (adenosine(37)-N6)-threonylcarbamoyltransferase complex ATPase subunit type 1 TsaE [Thermoanaerobacterales bacterium]